MLRYCRRNASSWSTSKSQFKLNPQYVLKCGLEIHTQLNTPHKLFSHSTNDSFSSIDKPNTHTSFFDVSLPGTQPILNTEVVIHALKLAKALNSNINLESTFDRKHYFYGDQPLGYQITQHYNPFAKDGVLTLNNTVDDIDEKSHPVNIIQLQIEQDTAKTVYDDKEHISLVDLNRSNVPLIEMVTAPDFHNLKQIKAFIKKYQSLVRHLKVSTGDLETGAIRIDVNISVNDHPRIELKNLPNTSSVINSVKYEYTRQVGIIASNEQDAKLKYSETRGWNGIETIKLRSKETTIDYRYMPDSELPSIKLDPSVIADISDLIPELPEKVMEKLMSAPYSLSSKDAKILSVASNGHSTLYTAEELLAYYLETFHCFIDSRDSSQKINNKLPGNWIIHTFVGHLNKLKLNLKNCKLSPLAFSKFLGIVNDKVISKTSGDLLLFHILENNIADPDFTSLIADFGLTKVDQVDEQEIEQICKDIIAELDDSKLVQQIQSGKKNGLKFLVGQAMRQTQGKVDAKMFETAFQNVLNVK